MRLTIHLVDLNVTMKDTDFHIRLSNYTNEVMGQLPMPSSTVSFAPVQHVEEETLCQFEVPEMDQETRVSVKRLMDGIVAVRHT